MKTAWLALILWSCAPEEDPGITLLTPREQLIRLSVDLRGIHPTEADLKAIEEDPALYEGYVDRWLHDPRFGERMERLFDLHVRTRTGETWFDPEEAGLQGVDERRLAASLAGEPLKLVRHVVENDLPWTEVVLADYTMADPLVAAMWGLDRAEGEGWQKAWYTDGRPHAGILSSTTLWTRYPSAGVNGNRHRANNISRILLCDDYLARPVSFARSEIDALVAGDPEDVIRETPICQSCHSSLDPLAAHFFGFWWEIEGDLVDQTTYRPEDEELWVANAGKAPGYFGRPTANLDELAVALAEDGRMVDCAVEQVFEGLTQRDLADADWTEVQAHRDAFVDGGLVIRDLVRSVVTAPAYRAAGFTDEGLLERVPTVKMVSPDQLSSILHAKTGYRWETDGWDALAHNDRGLAVLSGGTDGRYTVTPSHDPSVGMVFVQERLAQAAGWHVARHDLDPARTSEAILLRYVSLADTPDSAPEAFRDQIRSLYLDVTGLPLPEDATEPDDLRVLWQQLYSVDASPVSAWAGVVSVVLRDPRVLFY